MKVIVPPHNKKAERVQSWFEIRKEVEQMRDLVAGKFEGKWPDAASISHAQVSHSPLNFFVVSPKLTHLFNGKDVIINPEIVMRSKDKVKSKEACMSFPASNIQKMKRSEWVGINYQIPFLGMLWKKSGMFDGMAAKIIQHEIDHAHGKNIYDNNNYQTKRKKKKK